MLNPRHRPQPRRRRIARPPGTCAPPARQARGDAARGAGGQRVLPAQATVASISTPSATRSTPCPSPPAPSSNRTKLEPPPSTARTSPTRWNNTAATTRPPAPAAGPMRWLDTAESWAWFRSCWSVIFRAGRRRAGRPRRCSRSPSARSSASGPRSRRRTRLGNLAIPAGGLSTPARLRDDARQRGHRRLLHADLRPAHGRGRRGREASTSPRSPVRALIVAGEPGGSIPAVRARIEAAWGARVFDHTGMTEIGAVSLRVPRKPRRACTSIETEFIAEVIDPRHARSQCRRARQPGELVLTNLGRWGSPLIRYRTGDHVRLDRAGRPAPAAGGSPGWKAVSSAASTTCSSSAATTSSPPRSKRSSGGSRRSPSSASTVIEGEPADAGAARDRARRRAPTQPSAAPRRPRRRRPCRRRCRSAPT